MQEEGLKISITANADDAIKKLERVNELLNQFGQSVSQGASGSIQAPDSAAFRAEVARLVEFLKTIPEAAKNLPPIKIPAPDKTLVDGSIAQLKEQLKGLTQAFENTSPGDAAFKSLAQQIASLDQQIKGLNATKIPPPDVTFAKGSIKDLENELSVLQRKFKEADPNSAEIQRYGTEIARVKDKIAEVNALKIPAPDNTAAKGSIIELERELAKLETKFRTLDPGTAAFKSVGAEIISVRTKLETLNRTRTDQAFNNLGKSGREAGIVIQNTGRILSDSSFGWIAISNNIEPLIESYNRYKTKLKEAGVETKTLAQSLSGGGGIILGFTVVNALITGLVQKFGSLSNAFDAFINLFRKFDAAREGIKAFNDQLENAGKSVGSAIANAVQYRDIANNVALSDNERAAATDKLRESILNTLPPAEAELALTKSQTEQTNLLIDAIIKRGIQSAANAAIAKNSEGLLQNKVDELRNTEALAEAEKKLIELKKEAKNFERTTEVVNGVTVLGDSQVQRQEALINSLKVQRESFKKEFDQNKKVSEEIAKAAGAGTVTAKEAFQSRLNSIAQEKKIIEDLTKSYGRTGDIKQLSIEKQKEYNRLLAEEYVLQLKSQGVTSLSLSQADTYLSIISGTYGQRAESATKAAKAEKDLINSQISGLEELRKQIDLTAVQEQRLINLRTQKKSKELEDSGLTTLQKNVILEQIKVDVQIEGLEIARKRIEDFGKFLSLQRDRREQIRDSLVLEFKARFPDLKPGEIRAYKSKVDRELNLNPIMIDLEYNVPKIDTEKLNPFLKVKTKEFKDSYKGNLAADKDELDLIKQKYEDLSNLISENVTPVFDTLFSNVIEGQNAFEGMGKTLANIAKQFALAAVKAAVLAAAMQLIPGFGQAATAAGAAKGFLPNFLKMIGLNANPGSNIRPRTLQANMGDQLVAEVSGQKLQLLLQRTSNSKLRYA